MFLGCKFGIPALRRAGGGSIINTASFVAVLGAATPQVAYTASKGAVLAMTRELAVIHARENIRVNALCPGPLHTELLMRFLDTDEKKQRRLVHIPMGRFGEARGDGQGSALARLRRLLVRHRHRIRGRRRDNRRLRHAGVSEHHSFVDGAPTPGSAGEAQIFNPATGQQIGTVSRASASDVDRAVAVARDRYEEGEWRRAPVRKRRDVLRGIADLIRRDQERLALLESTNAGKPISAARGEIGAVATTFDFYAGAVDKFHGQTIPGNANGTLMTFREPIGVCAAITPWNFPMLILSWKAAPALAMGNSLVAKPAEVTPLTAIALAELAVEAGLPPGVFNVVTGRGSEAGEALVRTSRRWPRSRSPARPKWARR